MHVVQLLQLPNSVVLSLGLNPKHFIFHAFRRSGASLAFDHDVKLEHIKQHSH